MLDLAQSVFTTLLTYEYQRNKTSINDLAVWAIKVSQTFWEEVDKIETTGRMDKDSEH